MILLDKICTSVHIFPISILDQNNNILNELIKKLNGGVVDPKFKIDWLNYKNTILLTQQNELKLLRTKIHKIIEL
jgi:hypothetical protein